MGWVFVFRDFAVFEIKQCYTALFIMFYCLFKIFIEEWSVLIVMTQPEPFHTYFRFNMKVNVSNINLILRFSVIIPPFLLYQILASHHDLLKSLPCAILYHVSWSYIYILIISLLYTNTIGNINKNFNCLFWAISISTIGLFRHWENASGQNNASQRDTSNS